MRASIVAATLLLAGCGGRGELEPPRGATLPAAPYGARTRLTVDELLTPPPEARPQPAGDLLQRSQERESDRFDLPPPNR